MPHDSRFVPIYTIRYVLGELVAVNYVLDHVRITLRSQCLSRREDADPTFTLKSKLFAPITAVPMNTHIFATSRGAPK